jgi:exosortase/archaeosortase family protein
MAIDRRAWRFVLVVTAAGAAAALFYRDAIVGPLVAPLERLTAAVTSGLLRAVGVEAVRAGRVVYDARTFGFEISLGCTGLVPAAMLATAIAAYPATARHRLYGILVGVPLLLLVNLARLVHLFIVGSRWPGWFDIMHRVIWEAVMVLAVIGCWLFWARTRRLDG